MSRFLFIDLVEVLFFFSLRENELKINVTKEEFDVKNQSIELQRLHKAIICVLVNVANIYPLKSLITWNMNNSPLT